MSNGISAWADDDADYRRLCEKYREKPHKDSERSEKNPRGWVMNGASLHHDELRKREKFERKARTDDANAQNVKRYLGEATMTQLCAELKRRGYRVADPKREED